MLPNTAEWISTQTLHPYETVALVLTKQYTCSSVHIAFATRECVDGMTCVWLSDTKHHKFKEGKS